YSPACPFLFQILLQLFTELLTPVIVSLGADHDLACDLSVDHDFCNDIGSAFRRLTSHEVVTRRGGLQFLGKAGFLDSPNANADEFLSYVANRIGEGFCFSEPLVSSVLHLLGQV